MQCVQVNTLSTAWVLHAQAPILGSNTIQGMKMFALFCVVSSCGFAKGRSPIKDILQHA
jgi:hypothetical protein